MQQFQIGKISQFHRSENMTPFKRPCDNYLEMFTTYFKPNSLMALEAWIPKVESRSMSDSALPAASSTAFVLPLENSASNTRTFKCSSRVCVSFSISCTKTGRSNYALVKRNPPPPSPQDIWGIARQVAEEIVQCNRAFSFCGSNFQVFKFKPRCRQNRK